MPTMLVPIQYMSYISPDQSSQLIAVGEDGVKHIDWLSLNYNTSLLL